MSVEKFEIVRMILRRLSCNAQRLQGASRLTLSHFLALLCLCLPAANISIAAPDECPETQSLAQIASAKSETNLTALAPASAQTYRTRLVYAVRSFELRPKDRARAVALLNQIPTSEAEQTDVMTLGDSLCDAESPSQMDTLAAVGNRVPHDFALAAVLAPEKLDRYIRYALMATQDPHSDYAIQMEKVCRRLPDAFRSAVQNLSSSDRAWLNTHIFDPKTCHAIALPETE